MACPRRGARSGWPTGNSQRAIGRDVLSAPGDQGPVLGALMDSFEFSLRAITTGVSLEEAMTADIEWNGEAL